MPGEDVYSWSKTAASNATADTSINWAEGQPRASVNDSARSMMAALAKQFALFTGSIVTTGTANAQQFTSGVGYTTVPTNFYARLKCGVGLTNTGAMTLRMDGLASFNVLTATGAALIGGEFSANGYVEVVFNGTNWVLLGTTNVVTGGGGGGGGSGAPSSYTLATTPGNFFYNRAGGVTSILVECIGGGGAGGGTSAYPFAPGFITLNSAAGGGSGGYSRKLLTAADFAIKEPIMVAFGGLGGFGQPGLFGGTTQFGSPLKCQAFGGRGGRGEGAEGGAGGVVTGAIGDLVLSGTPGEAGHQPFDGLGHSRSFSGAGGSSQFGGGAPKEQNPPTFYGTVNGLAGRYGGGGSGGAGGSDGSGFVPGSTGGDGGHGVILITEWGGHGTITTS